MPKRHGSAEHVQRRSWWRGALRLAVFLGLAAGAGLGWLYHKHVVRAPGEHVGREHVLGIIAQESPVYFRDGQTRVGVFFEDEHRRFVPWAELPRAYVASIVAAEDSRFWSHPGFDVVHIARAMRDNIRAGTLVAGGSTLTQQTAKNLYYRPDRSLKSKLHEALNALRLEYHFDKTEILTFYANQFHVTGNGRGLGIAARHFFDREPDELGVLECAFLAGLVKAPSYYDPYIGDEARRARAIERAHERTRYVLRRVAEVEPSALVAPDASGAVSTAGLAEVRRIQDEAKRLLDDGFTLPFRRGVFRFDSSAVLDEVARRLSEPPFAEVLAQAKIEDPATAGLQVITTLDADAQRAATYGLWHHLTEVGVMLEGKEAEDFVRADARAPRFDPDHVPVPGTFRLATVSAVVEDQGKKHLVVDLGGNDCTVDRTAMVRVAVATHRGAVQSSTAKTNTAGVNAFVDALPLGSVVWTSVREVADGVAFCDLELRPELQGALVVLENGELRAMVGGNDNRNFNRAAALRQMGSTWKPLVFHAAMQLGWDAADVLDNRRTVFPFSTTMYYPRPDHTPEPEVTLAWAGTRSENLASVWLLYHLLDRLSPAAVAELAANLGLARGEEESESDYRLRIQKSGVLPTPSRVREAHYLEARHEVSGALRRAGHLDEIPSLLSLSFGWGFGAERRRVDESWKRDALDWSWGTMVKRRSACRQQLEALAAALDTGVQPPSGALKDLRVRTGEEGRWTLVCGSASEDYRPLTSTMIAEVSASATGGKGKRGRKFLGGLFAPKAKSNSQTILGDLGEVRIDGRLRLTTLDEVESALTRLSLRREVQGDDAPGLYDPEVLYWHQDFRVLLALRYVRDLAATYGVRTEVREVLSMPLGASEVTIEEMTKVYEGITSGENWRFPGRARGPQGAIDVAAPDAATLLISEIRSVDGVVLYRAAPTKDIVAPLAVAAMTGDVLDHVITSGTGRRASGQVSLGGAPIPLGGKTGTTNDFRNAAFVGVAPVVEQGELTVGRNLVVGAYVGYDNNRSMKSGRIKLAGASGALPAWLETVRGLADAGMLGKASEAPADGWVRETPDGLVTVEVDVATGLLVDGEAEDVALVLSRERPPVMAAVDRLGKAARVVPRRLAPSTLHVDSFLRERDEQLRHAETRKGLWAPFRRERGQQRAPDKQ